jgi:hypothetical protein
MSNPRTCLTIAKPKAPEPILEPKLMEATILTEVRSNPEFRSAAGTGLVPERPDDETGWLYSTCSLSQLRLCLGIQTELEDDKILAGLDRLQERKQVLIWRVPPPSRWMRAGDFQFEMVLGAALRGKRSGFTYPQVEPIWLDPENFKQAPKKPCSATERVAAINKRVRERLDRIGGRIMPDFDLENKLRRADAEENARLKAAILRLAERTTLQEADLKKLMDIANGKHEK